MTRPRPHSIPLARLGGSLPAAVLPLAHAADYLEGAVLGIAFVVFIALVLRERARARRAAPEEPFDASAHPGSDAPAVEPGEPRGPGGHQPR